MRQMKHVCREGLARASRAKGSSLVEFALIVPLFFILIFGIIDFGRIFFIELTLQNALRQAGRFAVTGNHLPDPNNPTIQLSRINSIIQTAKQAAAGVDVSNIQISSLAGGNAGPNRAGGPGDTITISITVNLHLITPLIGRFFGPSNTYTFVVSTSFRNEPFPPSATT